MPDPVPDFDTVNARCRTNVADTDLAAFMVTLQVPVPEQPAPLHPVNTDPGDAAAVRATAVP